MALKALSRASFLLIILIFADLARSKSHIEYCKCKGITKFGNIEKKVKITSRDPISVHFFEYKGRLREKLDAFWSFEFRKLENRIPGSGISRDECPSKYRNATCEDYQLLPFAWSGATQFRGMLGPGIATFSALELKDGHTVQEMSHVLNSYDGSQIGIRFSLRCSNKKKTLYVRSPPKGCEKSETSLIQEARELTE